EATPATAPAPASPFTPTFAAPGAVDDAGDGARNGRSRPRRRRRRGGQEAVSASSAPAED
ncbi:MAG TPA: hypothetical protein VGD67_11210, partial [Pseudonocardiaceae bacterium]